MAALRSITILIIVSLILLTPDLHGQRRSWNWYFGDRAGVTFRNGVVEPLSNGVIQTDEGCASFSNPANGDLWLYTDGVTVWNRNHQPMPNGTGLNGDASTSQSALIVQMPGTVNKLVIITPAPLTSSDGGSRCLCLMYSVVDMSADSGRGDVIEKNTVLIDDVTEHVTATATCDETGWWIIARRRSTPSFVSFKLTASGFETTPTISPADPLPPIRDIGIMQTSPDGRRLVITSPSGEVHLYRILRTTGLLYDGISLFNGESVGTTYGTSFTTDSRYVYIGATESGLRNGTALFRFDVLPTSAASVRASRQSIGFLSGSLKYAAMQLASDGNIYVARPDESWLGRVVAPSSTAPLVEERAVALTGVCQSGLPNFSNWIFGSHPPGNTSCLLPDVLVDDTTLCANACFTPSVRTAGIIESWEWSLPGAVPSTSIARTPTFCVPIAGRYTCTVIVRNSTGSDTATFTVTVRTGPNIDVTPSVTICTGDTATVTATGAKHYTWWPTTGVSDPTSPSPLLYPAVTTTYTLVGTDAAGCLDTTTVRVVVVDLHAGPDLTLCPGDTAQLTTDSAETYLWQPATGLSSPNVRSPLAFPTETTAYTVSMQQGSCTITDTVVVTVSASLAVRIEAPNEACEGERVQVRAIGSTGRFTWSGDGVEPSDSATTWVTVQRGGIIIVHVRRGNCSAVDTAQIQIGGGPVVRASADTAVCPTESVTLTATTTSGSLTWTTLNGSVVGIGTSITVTPMVTTDYVVVSGLGTPCTAADTVRVRVRNGPTITAGPDLGVCLGRSVQIQAFGNAESFFWAPSNGLSDPTAASPIAAPEQTTLYIVMAVRDGCVAYDTVLVEVSDGQIDVTGPTTVCIGETVELVASGSARYSWSPSDGLSDPSIANPLARPLRTTTYRVVGSDRFGCTDTAYITIEVLDTLGLTLQVGDVTAEAGAIDVGIPVYVNVDAGSLPVRIDELRATLVVDASTFIPDSAERGLIVTSVRGNEQLVYLLMRDIPIVTTGQRITQIRGRVLLGRLTTVPLRWESVSWSGLTCPREETVSGQLTVTGCNIRNRAIRLFAPDVVRVVPRPHDGVAVITLDGTEPGAIHIQVVSIDGRVVASTSVQRRDGIESSLSCALPLHHIARGLYHVVVRMPSTTYSQPMPWLE